METKIADIFKVLSDENRVKILKIIDDNQEICACELLKHFNITQPTLAYHMKLLMDANLVTCYKRGTWCIYQINYIQMTELGSFINSFKEGVNS